MTTTDEPRADDRPAVPVPFTSLVLATLGVIVVVVAATFATRLEQVAGLVLAAVTMSLLTLPAVRRLRPLIGRGGAIALTAIGTAIGSLAVVYLAVRDLSERTARVGELVEERLESIPSGSLVDRVVSATRLEQGVAAWLDDVPSRLFVGGGSGAAIATQVFLFLTVVVLAAFLQSSGEPIVDWFVRRWPREGREGDEVERPRREIREFLDDVERRGIGAVRRLLALVLAVALAVGAVGTLVDLPGAIALGLWVGAWSVAPVVGPPVALAPAVLLPALDQRPVAWSVVAVAVVAIVAANRARTRWIDPLVRLGAGPHVLAVAAGVALAGVGGTIVTLVLAAVVAAGATSSAVWTRPEPWHVPAEHTWRMGGLTLPGGWRLVVLAAGVVTGAVLVWVGLLRLGRGAVWLLVGGFVAVALARPVSWLVRRTPLGRRSACALVCALVGAAVVAATLTGADDGARATTTLTERLPSIVAGLEDAPVVGGWLEERDAAIWVEEQMNDLPQRVRTGRPADWLPFFSDRLVDLFWVLVLAIALLVDGPRLVDAATHRVPARHRRQWTRLVAATGTALGGYAAGAAIVASINASVIFVVAVVLGLGVAPALALWGFLWNFVPQIGGFMGGLPLIVFALVLGPLQGLFAAVVFIGYQFVENHLIQPSVIGAAIDIAPWGTLLAAIAGAAAAGVVGAIVLTPLVGVIGVIRRELAREDFPGQVASTSPDP